MVNNFCDCPICKSYATSVHRRFLDHITSTFNPTYCYRCLNNRCDWQGNILQQSLKTKSNLY
jgi:hypothetical protein